MNRTNNKKNWFADLLYDKYQRLRRNPDYIEVARKIQFDADGFESTNNIILDTELRGKVENLRKRWGLNLIVDPSKEIPKDKILEEHIFEDYSLVEFELRENETNSFDPLWDDHYIMLKIDIRPDKNQDQIIRDVLECIRESRELLSVGNQKNKRYHFSKRETYYQIWDMRKECKPFKDIARQFQITEDHAKKRFAKAYEFINGEKLEKAKWLSLLREHFERSLIKDNGNIDEEALKKLEKMDEKEPEGPPVIR